MTAERSRMVDTDHLMSITEASSKGVSALARAAEQGTPTVLMRSGRPVAAVVPLDAYFAWLAGSSS